MEKMKKLLFILFISFLISLLITYLLYPKQQKGNIVDTFIATKRVYWNGDIKENVFIITLDSNMINIRDLKAEEKYKNKNVITDWSSEITFVSNNNVYTKSGLNGIFEYQKNSILWYTSDTTGVNYSLYCTFYK